MRPFPAHLDSGGTGHEKALSIQTDGFIIIHHQDSDPVQVDCRLAIRHDRNSLETSASLAEAALQNHQYFQFIPR